jgi:hypothetical protein
VSTTAAKYHSTTDTSLRNKVHTLIKDKHDFTPSLLHVITWTTRIILERKVKSNIYQAVIATDVERTFVLLIYESIEDIVEESAIIGFNAGDGCRFFSLPESSSREAILNLENTSNVGIQGTYIFRADQAFITRVNETGEYKGARYRNCYSKGMLVSLATPLALAEGSGAHVYNDSFHSPRIWGNNTMHVLLM